MPSEEDGDDNDEVGAIGDDLPEDVDTGGDDGADPSDAFERHAGAVGIPAGDVNTGPGRVISKVTRELFAKAAAKLKGQLGDDGDEYEAAIEGEPEPDDQPLAPGGAPAAGAPPASPGAPPPPGAAAATPSPEAEAVRARNEARAAELDARETALTTRESASDFTKLREAYLERGAAPFLRQLLTETWKLTGDEEAFKDEVVDLITDLSANVLGVTVDPAVASRIDSKRTLRALKLHKSSIAEREVAQAQEAEAAGRKNEITRAANLISQEIYKPESATQYPHLSVEEDAGALVMEVILAEQRRGNSIKWTDAAKRADDYLKSQGAAWFDKRRHLFTTAPAKAGAPVPNGNRAPERPVQRHPGARTISNDMAATTTTPPAPPSAPKPGEAGFTMEAHRAATKRKMRKAFKERPAEE